MWQTVQLTVTKSVVYGGMDSRVYSTVYCTVYSVQCCLLYNVHCSLLYSAVFCEVITGHCTALSSYALYSLEWPLLL